MSLRRDARDEPQEHMVAKEASEEILARNTSLNEDDQEFDEMIGALQEILFQDAFVELQHTFGETHCEEFDETEENKLIYTKRFEEYTTLLEDYIEEQMRRKLGNFHLSSLIEALQERKGANWLIN